MGANQIFWEVIIGKNRTGVRFCLLDRMGIRAFGANRILCYKEEDSLKGANLLD